MQTNIYNPPQKKYNNTCQKLISQTQGAPMNKSFTKKITKKNIFYIILICFILSVIPLYVIGMFAHPSVDDYYYGTETVQVWNETHSIASVVKCSFDEMINTYNIWQGNFSAIFLMRLQPGIFGEQYYLLRRLYFSADRKSTRLNSSHDRQSRMPSSA